MVVAAVGIAGLLGLSVILALLAFGLFARNAERSHRQQPIKRPHTARRLDLNVRRRVATHQFQIFVGRPGIAVTCAGLYEIGPNVAADSAELLLVVVGQEAVLEDDLHEGFAAVRCLDDSPDVIRHIAPIVA